MNPLNIVSGVLSAVLLAGIGYYVWSCEDAKAFKDKAVVLAEAARDAAIKQMVKDRKAKEQADENLKVARSDNVTLDERLRDERARASRMSRPAPRAPSPERACFKGPIIDAAVTRLIDDIYAENERRDAELSEIARQCQDAVSALDSVKAWAKSLSSNAPPPRQ